MGWDGMRGPPALPPARRPPRRCQQGEQIKKGWGSPKGKAAWPRVGGVGAGTPQPLPIAPLASTTTPHRSPAPWCSRAGRAMGDPTAALTLGVHMRCPPWDSTDRLFGHGVARWQSPARFGGRAGDVFEALMASQAGCQRRAVSRSATDLWGDRRHSFCFWSSSHALPGWMRVQQAESARHAALC